MPDRRRGSRLLAAALVAALVLVGCAEAQPYGSDEERRKGKDLVDATQEAGVAPELTVDVAVSLYGPDALSVCGAFEGGLTAAEELVLLGNLAQGRRKTITDDALAYSRLVVQTYCPDLLPDFDAAVQDVDPVGT